MSACKYRYGQEWHVIERAVAIDPECVLALVFAADYEVAKCVRALSSQSLRS